MIDDYDDMLDLKYEAQWQRRYDGRLSAAPDCRDPDHPGCPECMPEEDEDE